MNMDLTIALTCEYICNRQKCQTYLEYIEIDPKLYEYVYAIHKYDEITNKKSIRKLLINKICPNLSQFPHLIMLECGVDFNQKLPTLPNTITYLEFMWYFNYKLPKLPSQLTHLIFTGMFNKQLPKLPESLLCLVLSDRFNHPLPQLPNKLRILILGLYFDCRLPKLPESLHLLNLGYGFNIRSPKLPDKLQYLYLSHVFMWRLPKLPNSLIEICAYNHYIHLNLLRSLVGDKLVVR
jgi:hypothetical protein